MTILFIIDIIAHSLCLLRYGVYPVAERANQRQICHPRLREPRQR